jgi:DNA polymerase-3 subunit delta'
MGFEALLGNDRLKDNLTKSIGRGKISHFYLISGPEGAGKKTLGTLLSAAILCKSSEKPCLSCPACRKVMGNAHPDVITIDDPEKKTVPVDLIRKARADVYIRPNEGSHKIYVIPRAQDLNLSGQNALLKVLEEPPEYGVFLLLTDNPQKLLPTVRSRCTELALSALPSKLLEQELRSKYPQAEAERIKGAAARSGGFLGQALALMEQGEHLSEHTKSFLESYAAADSLGLTRTLVPMEKLKRDQLIQELTLWLQVLENALASRSGMTADLPMAGKIAGMRSGKQLLSHIKTLQKCIQYAQGNVSVAAICGYLQWELR